MLHSDRIICEAYGAFQGFGQVEIGTITHPDHRQAGHATVLCHRLATLLESRGAAVVWSCDADNAASAAVARKLGFQTERSYAFYGIRKAV